MGENSEISWTHHTFNIVIGCAHVKGSRACAHCYAEAMAKRYGWAEWGEGTPRHVMSDAYWKQPYKWDRAAARDGVRRRVFCSSLADVFEDHPTVEEQRARLWPVIRATPHLDWMLLTKRAHRIEECLPDDWGAGYPNVWLGVTAEDQKWADIRIPFLVRVPAVVRFISAEPLLGPVSIEAWRAERIVFPRGFSNKLTFPGPLLHLVIAGGESGPKASPTHPDWVRSLRDECRTSGIAFHFKQWGNWIATYDRDVDDPDWRRMPKERKGARYLNLAGGHGLHGERVVFMKRAHKKTTGRALDGRIYDEMPAPRAEAAR